jgi:hypothetical protein
VSRVRGVVNSRHGVNGGHAVQKTPPPLGEGEERCPVCRRNVRRHPTRGTLCKHVDLWGDKCWGPPEEFDPPIR